MLLVPVHTQQTQWNSVFCRPLVEEGNSSGAHGTVICKLCVRHGKNNNFTGEGYQWAARFSGCALPIASDQSCCPSQLVSPQHGGFREYFAVRLCARSTQFTGALQRARYRGWRVVQLAEWRANERLWRRFAVFPARVVMAQGLLRCRKGKAQCACGPPHEEQAASHADGGDG